MIKKILYLLNVVLLLLTLASTFSAYIDPASFGPSTLLSLAFPICVVLNILMIFYWAVIEPKNASVSFIALLLCCNSVLNLISWNKSVESEEDTTVRIMSYNLGGSYFLTEKEKHQRDKWMPRDILTKKIDIIALQEAGSKLQFDDQFLDFDKHHFSETGTSIYSRFPIVKKGKIDFGYSTNSAIWTDLRIHDKTYRFYSVHLKSNQITTSDLEALNDINRDYERNLEETKSVLRKYQKESKIRSKQVKQLLAEIEKSPHPVIVCGDFNEPPYSYVYKKMTADHCDTFRERGKGFASSFAGKIPYLRIDYVFVDEAIKPLKHEVGNDKWSDHFPVMVALEL